jgi:hypothetical protein
MVANKKFPNITEKIKSLKNKRPSILPGFAQYFYCQIGG